MSDSGVGVPRNFLSVSVLHRPERTEQRHAILILLSTSSETRKHELVSYMKLRLTSGGVAPAHHKNQPQRTEQYGDHHGWECGLGIFHQRYGVTCPLCYTCSYQVRTGSHHSPISTKARPESRCPPEDARISSGYHLSQIGHNREHCCGEGNIVDNGRTQSRTPEDDQDGTFQ